MVLSSDNLTETETSSRYGTPTSNSAGLMVIYMIEDQKQNKLQAFFMFLCQ